jgi:hypothetical protein
MRDRLDLPLLTWRLWNALRWPPVRNPVYGRTLRTSQRGRQIKVSEVLIPGVVRRHSPLWGFIAGIAFVFLICSGGWVILIPLLCATPLLMLGAGTACGLICAVKIATTLSAEHEHGRHDLLALTPSGAAGTAWAVSSAVYNNSPLMNQIKDLARGVYFLLALGAAWLTLPVLLNFGRFTFYSGNLVALVWQRCILT